MVPVPPGVPALPGSDPCVGGGGSAESSNQRGPPLRVAACYSRHVHQQVLYSAVYVDTLSLLTAYHHIN